MIESAERRKHWPTDEQFFNNLRRYMTIAEEQRKEDNERFRRGDERMESIEKDLRPLKALYYAVLGSGAIATLLVALILFVYSEDRASLKLMQSVLYTQGTAIEKLYQSHMELQQSTRREFDRLDRRGNGG